MVTRVARIMASQKIKRAIRRTSWLISTICQGKQPRTIRHTPPIFLILNSSERYLPQCVFLVISLIIFSNFLLSLFLNQMDLVLNRPVCSTALLNRSQSFTELYRSMCCHTAEMCCENGLHTNTFILAVNLIDRALYALMSSKKIKFRLLSCTCLLLACKVEEIYVRLYVGVCVYVLFSIIVQCSPSTHSVIHFFTHSLIHNPSDHLT